MMQKEILHYFIVNSGLAKFEWKRNMEKNFSIPILGWRRVVPVDISLRWAETWRSAALGRGARPPASGSIWFLLLPRAPRGRGQYTWLTLTTSLPRSQVSSHGSKNVYISSFSFLWHRPCDLFWGSAARKAVGPLVVENFASLRAVLIESVQMKLGYTTLSSRSGKEPLATGILLWEASGHGSAAVPCCPCPSRHGWRCGNIIRLVSQWNECAGEMGAGGFLGLAPLNLPDHPSLKSHHCSVHFWQVLQMTPVYSDRFLLPLDWTG